MRTAVKAGSFSRGGGDRRGVISAVPLGSRCGDEDVVVSVAVEVVDSVGVEAVGAEEVWEVPAASGSEEPEHPGNRSAAAQITYKTALVTRALGQFDPESRP
jgi:hypothetical protein